MSKKEIFISIISLFILFFIFLGLYLGLPQTKTLKNESDSQYRTWNNETNIVLKKTLNQWHWTYKDNNRKFEQLCDTWKHSSIFYADNDIVSTYNNKIFNIYQRSYLKNYKGDVINIVDSGSVWETVINQQKIKVSYLIYDKDENIIGYVSGINFINNEIIIKDIYGNDKVKAKRNRLKASLWNWEYTQYDGNTFSLPLIVGISSKVSFDGSDTDICNGLYQASFIIMITISFCIFLIIIYSLWNYYKNLKNN